MIQKDQPTIFPGSVIAGMSSTEDGNMKYLSDDHRAVDDNRSRFLQKLGIELDQAVLLRTTYDGDDYLRHLVVAETNKGEGMVKPVSFNSDSLATRSKKIAIFLPIADCIGAIMYDADNEALMVTHFSRQHTQQHGATRSIEFMTENFRTDPGKLLVWMGPAPSKESYPLFTFDNRSLHDVNLEHLTDAGVDSANVTVCPTDTVKDHNYFSHSEFLKGRRETDGRYAIVAMLH